MREASAILEILKRHKRELKKEFSVKQIGLFGSYARGEEKKKSDVDILVDFSETPNLFDFVELRNKLTALIGKKVDLVPKSALKPRIGRNILRETVFV